MGYSNFTSLNGFFLPRSSFTPTDLWANQTNNRGASPLAATERKTNGFIWRPGKSEKSENIHGVFGVVLAGGLGFFRMELEWIWMDYKHRSWVSTTCWLLIIPNFPRKKEEQIMNCPLFGFQKCPPRSLGEKIPTGWMFPVIRLDLWIEHSIRQTFCWFNQTYPFSHNPQSWFSGKSRTKWKENIQKYILELHDTFSTLNHFLWEDTGYQFRDGATRSSILGRLKPPRSKVYNQNSVIWVEERIFDFVFQFFRVVFWAMIPRKVMLHSLAVHRLRRMNHTVF